jgi:hypothetical protein
VDSLETLLGFDEFEYLALFLWLAIAGAGPLSVDAWFERRAKLLCRPATAQLGAHNAAQREARMTTYSPASSRWPSPL